MLLLRPSWTTNNGIRVALATIAFTLAVSAALAAQGANAADIIGAGAYAEIQAKGKAVRTDSGSTPSLLPSHAAADGIRAAIAAEKPSVIVETVFAIPRAQPADAAGRKAELAAVYGLMRSFSTLEGIEYYSVSHKAMRVLYVESYRIDDAQKRVRLPDESAPAADSIPGSETILAFQKDLSLGANVYSYAFTSYPDAVFVDATNLTRMSYGIIPMVSPGGFKTRLLVIAANDAIVFYAVITADAPGIVRTRLGESLANRAEALFRWFKSNSTSILTRP